MRDAEPRARIDFDAIKRRVSVQQCVEAFVPGIKLRRQGHDLVGLSPFKLEKTPSFRITERKGVWFCFATGQGGDVIRFVQKLLGLEPIEAARRLAEVCLNDVPTIAVEDPAELRRREEARELERQRQAAEDQIRTENRIKHARDIWDAAGSAAGTLAEVYLTARGIDLEAIAKVYGSSVPACLRFSPRASVGEGSDRHHGPAMIAWIGDVDGRFRGIHRTFLAKDGSAKASIASSKAMLGQAWGGFSRVTPETGEAEAIVGEGFETTLTVVAALARQGRRVQAFVALSLGNLCGAGLGDGRPHPHKRGHKLPALTPDPDRPGLILPAHIKRITILEDADGKDRLASEAHMARAVAKFQRLGLKVKVASPMAGADFNDMARVA